jgi:DNA-binding transcriptional MerR regulator/methylmalonyl-CoA mutase cobalamin-binding subunit
LQKTENAVVNYTVKAAARATGVSESRLRTWERRYGIPKPARSVTGRRLYDEDDLAAIRRMAALVEAGLSAQDAAAAVRSGEEASLVRRPVDLHPLTGALVAAAERYEEGPFLDALAAAVTELGWAAALDQVAFPALKRIGAEWEAAALPPAKEHFASELVRRRLAAAYDALGPSQKRKPTVLMACPESERHELGLLALAFLLRSAAANVVYLGADVPTGDIVNACESLDPDAVCLSATSAEGLASLARATRIILSRRPVRLFVGGPAVSPTGTLAAGIVLPPTLELATAAILERLWPNVVPEK